MALEPITRQEQIIAGKDLEPITRMEKFLKDYGVSNYFGETTVAVRGDTLTWDGNTEGLVCVADMLYKVSDNALNDEQIKACTVTVSNGMSVVVADYWDTLVQVGAATDEMVCVDELAFFVKKDGATLSAIGLSFPEAGIYVAKAGDVYVNSIVSTEPIFVTTTTVVKPLDEKYMPILTGPSGKKFKLTVDDSGAVTATEV